MRTTTIYLSLIAGLAFVVFLGMQYAGRNAPKEETAQDVNDNYGMPKPPPEIEKLNAVQKELATLTDDALSEEFTKLSDEIKSNEVFSNNGAKDVNFKEHPELKEKLIRLSLIRAERSKRGLAAKDL